MGYSQQTGGCSYRDPYYTGNLNIGTCVIEDFDDNHPSTCHGALWSKAWSLQSSSISRVL